MIKNILAAAVIGAATFGAQAATNLLDNGSFDGTVNGYVYNASPASVALAYGPVPTAAGTVTGWDGAFVSISSNSSAWQPLVPRWMSEMKIVR